MLGISLPELKVLYLALEDTEYRLADRLKKLPAGVDIELPVDGEADICTDCAPLSGHGFADLRAIFARATTSSSSTRSAASSAAATRWTSRR